ncbi:MAG: DUF429 domain-containing protein, partial [Pseudomonadales bacterium]|nr:DUF429 domain-containing protein [Pseudomonadales bacterium]
LPIPRGSGNAATLDPDTVAAFAHAVLAWLQAVERHLDASIAAIAIDAPSSFAINGRRQCERAMDARGINCFATPTRAGFDEIRRKARQHLDEGGAVNRLPHANQLWMLVGFALFDVLKPHYTCLEVFPQAIVRTLGAADIHKFKKGGVEEQLAAVGLQAGWSSQGLSEVLAQCVPGPSHDRLDAFMCAWVASLYPDGLEACGVVPDDVIWVPKVDEISPLRPGNQAWSVSGRDDTGRERTVRDDGVSHLAAVSSGDCLCCQQGRSTTGPKICPVCDHVFKGIGWGGIDAHWRSRHEDLMPYEDFWQSLCVAHKAAQV